MDILGTLLDKIMAKDKFGISMLAPSSEDGRVWINKWDDFGPRRWKATGIDVKSPDPFDNDSYLHCGPGYDYSSNVCTVNGNGILTMEGPSPRLFIGNNNEFWGNVEITCYFKKTMKVQPLLSSN